MELGVIGVPADHFESHSPFWDTLAAFLRWYFLSQNAFLTILARDQYGNYVIQHVLDYGKPHEQSEIIQKLVGQIVKMSQQKFASNVAEKCLTFGSPEERQLLVKEILGSTDENEPLQAMMKDLFGNYIV